MEHKTLSKGKKKRLELIWSHFEESHNSRLNGFLSDCFIIKVSFGLFMMASREEEEACFVCSK